MTMCCMRCSTPSCGLQQELDGAEWNRWPLVVPSPHLPSPIVGPCKLLVSCSVGMDGIGCNRATRNALACRLACWIAPCVLQLCLLFASCPCCSLSPPTSVLIETRLSQRLKEVVSSAVSIPCFFVGWGGVTGSSLCQAFGLFAL